MTSTPNADSAPCGLCGSPAVGFATIDGVRYCHQDESPTCYERAQWLGRMTAARRLPLDTGPTLGLHRRDGAYQLVYPRPDRCWSINDERRWHWAKLSRLVAEWRNQTRTAAELFRLPALEGRWEVRATLPFTRGGRRDPSNFLPPVKAAIDGLVDAGVWPDDVGRYVAVAEPELRICRDHLVIVDLCPLVRRNGDS